MLNGADKVPRFQVEFKVSLPAFTILALSQNQLKETNKRTQGLEGYF